MSVLERIMIAVLTLFLATFLGWRVQQQEKMEELIHEIHIIVSAAHPELWALKTEDSKDAEDE